jgi:hypothetical protein
MVGREIEQHLSSNISAGENKEEQLARHSPAAAQKESACISQKL